MSIVAKKEQIVLYLYMICTENLCMVQGGMKAVLWADTVQMLIVYSGMITLVVVGSNVMGGLDKAWDIADQRGRIVIFE